MLVLYNISCKFFSLVITVLFHGQLAFFKITDLVTRPHEGETGPWLSLLKRAPIAGYSKFGFGREHTAGI